MPAGVIQINLILSEGLQFYSIFLKGSFGYSFSYFLVTLLVSFLVIQIIFDYPISKLVTVVNKKSISLLTNDKMRMMITMMYLMEVTTLGFLKIPIVLFIVLFMDSFLGINI